MNQVDTIPTDSLPNISWHLDSERDWPATFEMNKQHGRSNHRVGGYAAGNGIGRETFTLSFDSAAANYRSFPCRYTTNCFILVRRTENDPQTESVAFQMKFHFYKVDGSSVGGPLAGTATPHRTDIIFVPPHGQLQLLAASVCLEAASFKFIFQILNKILSIQVAYS